jgi:arylsulfatase A-like enzyme
MRSAKEIAIGPGVGLPIRQSASTRVRAGTVLLIGTWIGLIAGFCDVCLLVLNAKIIRRDFYHLGGDFPWIVPSAIALLVLLPAGLIALCARIRGTVPLAVPVGVLSLIGFFELSCRLQLQMWAALIVGVGLAIQSVRFVRPRGDGYVRLVRWTAGWLVASLVATILLTIGGRDWSEHRQKSALPTAPAGARNVLLVVWDTVRSANTSLYGYRRATTPNLQRLASRGVRFELAFSTSSWTLPSHASMFTGRWPHELRVNWKAPMRDDVPTLAGYLASRGYDTAGFVANLDYCNRETGLARGFAHYEDYQPTLFDILTRYVALGRRIEVSSWASAIESFLEKHTGRWYDVLPRSKEHDKTADAINKSFLGWLGERPETRRPFFAFLNYNDAHTPYEVPDPSIPGFGSRPSSASQRQILRSFTGVDKFALSVEDVRMAADVYDDCIFYLDLKLGLLLDELSRRGVLENTLVIVASDHGEHLGDHGLFFHGGSLYRQLVQVPLLIAGHGGIPSGRTVAEAVSLCDIPATVIDLLGLGPDHPFAGQSVARYWQPPAHEGERVAARPLLMETTKPELLMNGGREPAARGPMKSVIAGGMHYIRVADGSEELYSISSDVEEKVNLVVDANILPLLLQFRTLLDLMLRKQ